MNGIRPYVVDDVEEVLKLHTVVFTNRGKPGAGGPHLRSYYTEFLLENPWQDPELPSLVLEADGRIISFLGVIPRRFSFGGRSVRGAVATNFMAEPGSVKAAIGAAAIVKQFLAGPQDLSLCDGTAEVRGMWEPLGAIATSIFGVRWMRVLSPSLVVLRALHRPEQRSTWRPGPISRALGRSVDAVVNRSARLPFRLSPTDGETRSLGVSDLAEVVKLATRRYALGPAYDESDLRWLCTYIDEHTDRGRLEMSTVVFNGKDVGWFVHQSNPGRGALVLQIGALDGPLAVTARHMLHTTAASGALYVEGRLDPDLLHAFGGQMYCRQPGWKLAAARDPSLLWAIARGDALLSPLDGDPFA